MAENELLLFVSTLLHAWLYGFVPALWTHDVWWPTGAFLSTFFAVTWPAVYRSHAAAADQLYLHAAIVALNWTGAVLGVTAAWALRTPQLVDPDPFFDDSAVHARAELSKTTFHVLSVALFVTAEYFALQYYAEYVSLGASIAIASVLGALYVAINAGSYWVGRASHRYHENATRLRLLAIVLLTHVAGDVAVFVSDAYTHWYGLLLFVALAALFYPCFIGYAWRTLCTHERSGGAWRALVATAVVHCCAYACAWAAEECTRGDEGRAPRGHLGVVTATIAAYSLCVAAALVAWRALCNLSPESGPPKCK